MVGQYSEWVNDGDYDWPPKCSACSESLEGVEKPSLRLACLHVLHADCLDKHISSYPAYTAPAGYTCTACTTPVWPMKSQKDAASTLYTNLRSFISKSSAAGVLLGGATIQPVEEPVSTPLSSTTMPTTEVETGNPPASVVGPSGDNPQVDENPWKNGPTMEKTSSDTDIMVDKGNVVIDGVVPSADSLASQTVSSTSVSLPSAPSPRAQSPQRKPPTSAQHQQQNNMVPGVIPRKPSSRSGDRMAIDIAEEQPYHNEQHSYRDDDDGSDRKYARRGSLYTQLLRYVAPFWGPALQVLPVTAPQRKDERETSLTDELPEGRYRRRGPQSRRSVADPRKLLLGLAMIVSLATMLLLYYRLVQANILNTSEQIGQTR